MVLPISEMRAGVLSRHFLVVSHHERLLHLKTAGIEFVLCLGEVAGGDRPALHAPHFGLYWSFSLRLALGFFQSL